MFLTSLLQQMLNSIVRYISYGRIPIYKLCEFMKSNDDEESWFITITTASMHVMRNSTANLSIFMHNFHLSFIIILYMYLYTFFNLISASQTTCKYTSMHLYIVCSRLIKLASGFSKGQLCAYMTSLLSIISNNNTWNLYLPSSHT